MEVLSHHSVQHTSSTNLPILAVLLAAIIAILVVLWSKHEG